jgi:Family of unknown function (DUF5689)
MKYLSITKSGILLSISLLAGFMAILTGCVKQNFDEPPILCVEFPANATIDTLVKLYGSHSDTVRITQDIIIKGIVTGNDESGNIYKKFYLQDSTAGVDVEIDQVSLYTQFKVGQRVFIKCKGLYLGNYGGAMELGYLLNGGIGRIPASFIKDHIFADCIPKKKPVPDTLDYLHPPFDKYINKLVAIPNVRFPDAGSPFVIGGVTTSHNLGNADGEVINIILYTSSYASFSNNLLPEGIGTVQGIFTVFNGKFELLVRDLNDMVNFVDTGQPIIYKNNFDAAPPDWFIYTASGNAWVWGTASGATYMSGNGYNGSAPTNTWLISPTLDLTSVTNPILTFKTWTKYTDSGLSNPLEVKISTDYSGSGDPSVATWSNLQCNLAATNSFVWTSSGDISLAAFHQKVYVGFHYRSSGTASSTAASWEVDTFKLTGKK